MQPNGGSTTSSLRQWRKKDFVEKPIPSETNQSSTNENPSHIARVAPHTYYPRPPEDPCNYQQYSAYSGTYKPPAPVKYSEIVENQPPQTIEHITPVIQKPKEKEYVDMCNGPIQPHIKQYPDHIAMKPSAYPDSLPISHQYIPKDSQMYPFLQKQSQINQYMQKEPYQQFLSKYNMQSQFSPQYNSQPNDFLAHLNKLNPRMAQSIINDTHLREGQIPSYTNLDQSRPYPQPQRMYHSSAPPCNPNSPQRNLGPTYNYPQYNYGLKPNISPGDPYNRVPQYHHNASKYVPEQHISNVSPQRYYSEHVNYGPFPPNYQQLEYAQHYQHRRQFPQDYYLHPSFKGPYTQNPHIPPEEINAESGNRKSSLKQYLESWVEEDMVGNPADIIAPNQLNNNENIESVKGTISSRGGNTQDQPLYVLDTTDIPNDNLPHFLHLQQIEKLPDNIKGYYQSNQQGIVQQNPVVTELEKESLPGAIIPEMFNRECHIVATVENDEADEKVTTEGNLQNKVVQIHILENTEAAEGPAILADEQEKNIGERQQNEGVIKMCKRNVASPDLSDKSMPEITDDALKSVNSGDAASQDLRNETDDGKKTHNEELPNNKCVCVGENNNELTTENIIPNLEEVIDNNKLVISNNCDTQTIPKDLCDIIDDTNTSKDYETFQKTDLNIEHNNIQPSTTFPDCLQEKENAICNSLKECNSKISDKKLDPKENIVVHDSTSPECLDNLLKEIDSKTKEETPKEFIAEIDETRLDKTEANKVEETLGTNREEDEIPPPMLQKCVGDKRIEKSIKRRRKVHVSSKSEKRKKIKKIVDTVSEEVVENIPQKFVPEEQPPVILEEVIEETQGDVTMPVLEREAPDENQTNVVYHIDDANVVLQIGDELLEINVSIQNDKKIIMVKTFSDSVIVNSPEDGSCSVLEDQTTSEELAPIIENVSNVETVEELCENTDDIPIANDVFVYNEEIVSSSTGTELKQKLTAAKEIENILEGRDEKVESLEKTTGDDAFEKCLEPKPVKKIFKTKAALKLVEPQEITTVPCKSKAKRLHSPDAALNVKKKNDCVKNKCNKTKRKVQRNIESRDKGADKKKVMKKPQSKKIEEQRDKIQKNNIDMLYKMSIVPNNLAKVKVDVVPKCKENKVSVEKKNPFVSVQEYSITSSTCQDIDANDPRKRANKIIQQINDDWEDDFDNVKQEDVSKKRLSLQEYNDRKRNQEEKVDYDKLDLTSNLLQDVCKKRGLSPSSPPKLNVNFTNKTYSRTSIEKITGDKKEESLSSRIELQLPNQRRLLPKPNYNHEYLKNALMNDLHTVNQITATLMKENHQLMHRFLEQQRLTAFELKKVKQIIRYKRLVQHLTNMKLKETQGSEVVEETSSTFNQISLTKEDSPKCSEKRKKKRFRFLYSDSEPDINESPQLPDDNSLKRARLDNVVPAVDYSVHQGNSQGQLTLVFKRNFKSDPKMQPFVKLERIRSLDWLASKLY